MQQQQATPKQVLTSEDIARYQAPYRRQRRGAAIGGFILLAAFAPIWLWLDVDRWTGILIFFIVSLVNIGWVALRMRCPHCRASLFWLARSVWYDVPNVASP